MHHNIYDRALMMPDAWHVTARVRGAAHPMCFTDEVTQHQFPEGFKPINIEQYDGTTDPVVWIEDFLMHIHMALGDDLHAIKYLPLKLKGSARHWLNSLPKNSTDNWEDLEDAFKKTSKEPMSDLQMPMTSAILYRSKESRPKNSRTGS
jgi:hypothetical protein